MLTGHWQRRWWHIKIKVNVIKIWSSHNTRWLEVNRWWERREVEQNIREMVKVESCYFNHQSFIEKAHLYLKLERWSKWHQEYKGPECSDVVLVAFHMMDKNLIRDWYAYLMSFISDITVDLGLGIMRWSTTIFWLVQESNTYFFKQKPCQILLPYTVVLCW